MAEVFSTFKLQCRRCRYSTLILSGFLFKYLIPELQKAILGDKSIKDALDYAAKETTYMMEDAGY